MTDLPFLKVEGLGNDFLLLDRRTASPTAVEAELVDLAREAPQICDRRTGVGADGFLVVAPPRSEDASATMIVINHDGSRPEMCGNGLRCVAHFVAHDMELEAPTIDTDDGPKPCRVELDGSPQRARVTVDMGAARPLADQVPAGGHGRRFTGISMGNPHAIAFVGADEDPEDLARAQGPQIEVDPAYPNRTNVEFARKDPDGSFTLWVWERGCGITGACGTGACATAAAAVWSGLGPSDTAIPVKLPGGTLRITVPGDKAASVVMEGPSRFVFAGRVPLCGAAR